VFLDRLGDWSDGLLIPASMDGAKAIEIEPHRKCAEPFQIRTEFLGLQLLDGG